MPTLTGATKFFPRSAENSAALTLGSSISAGATIVPVNGLSTNYTDGDVVVLTIEPTSQTNKQVFTGTVAGGQTQVTGVTWTSGANVPHTSGVAIVDYVTATHWDLLQKGVTSFANQDGSLKTAAVQTALNISSTSTDWTPLATVPTVTASNGQREHQLTWTGVDYTGILQAGTKLRIPRTTTVPTQVGQFVAASSQYASKTSPAGITFTDNFTMEAWVYVDSYTSTNQPILARYDSPTNQGFIFRLTSAGQVDFSGFNGSNQSKGWTSYQSVPLGKWTHVAASISMSGTSGVAYIDLVAVPTSTGIFGTPTAITQNGVLSLGGMSNLTQYSNMKIAHARLWSTVRTAQQIRDNANKQLVGNETGLVGAWSLNGDWTDKTANANTLTPSGGAIATYADNSFSPIEHVVITSKPVYASGNTTATVFSGPCAIPNETLGTVSYSSASKPFGFPADKNKWTVSYEIGSTLSTGLALTNTWYDFNGFVALVVPTGAWSIDAKFQSELIQGASQGFEGHYRLANTANAPSGSAITPSTSMQEYLYSDIARQYVIFPTINMHEDNITLTSQATYKLYQHWLTVNSTRNMTIIGDGRRAIFKAECAYL